MKRAAWFLALGLGLSLALAHRAQAINASPRPITVHQPNGAALTLHLVGDEHVNWFQDQDGYPVAQAADGEYRYASRDDNGALVPTTWRVGSVDPARMGLPRGYKPSGATLLRIQSDRMEQIRPTAGLTPPTGTVKNLVVLAQFADHADTLTRAPSDYTTLMNTIGGDPTLAPTGSVRDVWKENSYQTLDLVSTVQNWVRLPFTEAYYADNNQGATIVYRDQMVTDALTALDATVNFANFDTNNDGYVDAIDVIHSGYGSEFNGNPKRIWSRQFNLANDWVSNDKNANGVNVKVSAVHTEPALWDTTGRDICHIGVIAHETGHFFGLPDLYDQDSDGAGVGSWCLMGNSWGWSNDQRYPPELCAWSKILLGYIHPTTVPLSTASYVVSQQETTPQAYRVDLGYGTKEYLLIECRKPTGFDREIPQGGLAIWHIDDNINYNTTGFNQNQGYPGMPGWPQNGAHYGDALLQADGRYDLEKDGSKNGDAGDLWHLGGNVMLNEGSVPNCDRYVTLFQPTGNEISVTGENATSETFFYRPGLWVDFSYGGFYLGTFDNPFNSLSSAISAAPDNWGIICKGGTTGERPTLTRPMTFRSWGGTTVVGP